MSKDVPVIGLNGFSKTHLVTGWRIGYLYYHDPENKLKELKNGIAKLARARLSASSVAQFAAVEILKTPSNHTVDMVRELKKRRDYSYDRLRKIEGINCVKPNGAFYLFPKTPVADDVAFVRALQEELILTVPGSGFGAPGHFRIAFCVDEDTIKRALPGFERVIKGS